MPGAVFIEGENVNLRTIEEEDLEFIRDEFNNPAVWKNLSVSRPQNLEQEREFFEQVISGDEGVHLAISKGEEMKGIISLEPHENDGEVAEIGIWIAEDFQGKGFGTEASELITDHAFNHLNYHKVAARAYEGNRGSNRIWEKLGFEKEGEFREQVYIEGSYCNVNYYGILEEEWNE